MVGKKISKVTGILYRLRNFFHENVLFTLYNSLIISYNNNNNNNNNIYLKSSIQTSSIDYKKYNDIYN